MKFEWESIINNSKNNEDWWEETLRTKVIGGWIVRHQSIFNKEDYLKCKYDDEYKDEYVIRDSMVFVPDPNHEWVIDYGN